MDDSDEEEADSDSEDQVKQDDKKDSSIKGPSHIEKAPVWFQRAYATRLQATNEITSPTHRLPPDPRPNPASPQGPSGAPPEPAEAGADLKGPSASREPSAEPAASSTSPTHPAAASEAEGAFA